MSLCPPCALKWLAWLDYRPLRPVRIAAGAAYDDTAAGVADHHRAVFEHWRSVVLFQQNLIRSACQALHKAPAP